jgi:hypothetical protein
MKRRERISPSGIIPEDMKRTGDLTRLNALAGSEAFYLFGNQSRHRRPRIKKADRVWVGSSTVGSEFVRIRHEAVENKRKSESELDDQVQQIRMML